MNKELEPPNLILYRQYYLHNPKIGLTYIPIERLNKNDIDFIIRGKNNEKQKPTPLSRNSKHKWHIHRYGKHAILKILRTFTLEHFKYHSRSVKNPVNVRHYYLRRFGDITTEDKFANRIMSTYYDNKDNIRIRHIIKIST